MDEFSTTSDTLDQAEEEILTPTLSDEALEAAAGMAEGQYTNNCPHTQLALCTILCAL
jgi:hypothetical protein